jgi:hypothetical protein
MWSNPAFLFLQEPLVHKQLSLITKTSLRGLDDSQLGYFGLPLGEECDTFRKPNEQLQPWGIFVKAS